MSQRPVAQDVDTHVHISTRWYEPADVLEFQMRRAGIAQAVLIQYMGELDNSYILRSAQEQPDRYRAVVTVDDQSHDAVEQLASYAEQGAAGVRLRPRRAQGPRPFALWEAAQDLGLAVSCAGSAKDFSSPEFLELVAAVPRLTFVLEHLGEKRRLNPAFTGDAACSLYSLIKPCPNVFVKLHGLGEATGRDRSGSGVFADPSAEVLRIAYAELGSSRLMWGSDFPASSGREGYLNTRTYPEAALRAEGLTDEEARHVFGGLARKVFGLPSLTEQLGATNQHPVRVG